MQISSNIKSCILLISVLAILICGYLFVGCVGDRVLKSTGIVALNSCVASANKNITKDSQFFLGSVSKQFTAYLVLKNLPDVDKPFSDYINASQFEKLKHFLNGASPNLRFENLKDIKIKHFLSHSSGYNFRTNKKNAEPGQVYRYDNLNYVIVGKILECVTGRDFKSLCVELFESLGMKDTFLMEPSTYRALYLDKRKLRASMELSGINESEITGEWKGISFSGGVVSTVNDLEKWAQFIRSKKEMFAYKVKTNIPNTYYAMGVFFNEKENIIWHHGILPIGKFLYVTALCYKVSSDEFAVFLANAYKKVALKDANQYILSVIDILIDKIK